MVHSCRSHELTGHILHVISFPHYYELVSLSVHKHDSVGGPRLQLSSFQQFNSNHFAIWKHMSIPNHQIWQARLCLIICMTNGGKFNAGHVIWHRCRTMILIDLNDLKGLENEPQQTAPLPSAE